MMMMTLFECEHLSDHGGYQSRIPLILLEGNKIENQHTDRYRFNIFLLSDLIVSSGAEPKMSDDTGQGHQSRSHVTDTSGQETVHVYSARGD